MMHWWDWVAVIGVILAALGVYATGIGVKFAYDQAKRGLTEAQATRVAVEEATRQLASNQLLLLLPRLIELGQRLEDAVAESEEVEARRALVSWHREASEVTGILKGMGNPHAGLATDLQRSIVSVSKAKANLISGDHDLTRLTTPARKHIDRVCQQVSAVAGELRAGLKG